MASTLRTMTTPDRTQALADQYTRIYGTEKDNDHIRGGKLMAAQIIVKCPNCGLQATVEEDRKPALLDRWRREHERMAERKEAG